MYESKRKFMTLATMAVGLALLPACDAEPEDAAAEPVPSFEEFEAMVETIEDGDETHYLVEGDMVFTSEEELRSYYDDMTQPGYRSIVHVSGGARSTIEDPMNITYCFVDGWGQPQGSYTAPGLDPVRNAVAFAARQWEAAGALRFIHRADRDGANCSSAGEDGVTFVVRHYSSPSTATGSFPSTAAQALSVPVAGLSDLLAVHEVGHLLGLRHEHIHSDATPQCIPLLERWFTRWEELTAYDPDSAMRYADCTTGSGIAGNNVSELDAAGIRELYGTRFECDLNGPSASHGGFGIHNSYVENTTYVTLNGWSVEIDFGDAVPQATFSYGGTYQNVGNSVIISGTDVLEPGERVQFGVGGTYSGGTPTISCQ